MKVKVISQHDMDGEVREYLIIDGKRKVRVGSLCECPEDATIGRDLVSCCDISGYMEVAVNAAKRGEEVTFEYVEDEDYEG